MRKLYLPLFVFYSALTSGCTSGSSSDDSSVIPNPVTAAAVTAVAYGLADTVVTLTNTGEVDISSLSTLQISSALNGIIAEDIANSTCESATFPLMPGSQCTYRFKLAGSNTVPGILSGTINLTPTFADGSSQSINLNATVTHYLYAANSIGVFAWNGSAWSTIGSGLTKVNSLLVAPDSNGNTVLYAGSSTGTSGQDLEIWNGSTWTQSSGSPTYVQALAYTNNNTVNTLFSGSIFNTAGPDSLNRFANNTWSATGSSLNNIQSLAVSGATDGTLYAGSIAGNSSGDAYAYSNGSWSQLGSGGPSYVKALVYDNNNNLLYAGSVLNASSSATGVNAWNGTTWTAVGSGAPSGVHTLALNGNNLYAAGSPAGATNYTFAPLSVLGVHNWWSTASSEDGSHLFGMPSDAGDTSIYISDDYGLTWTAHNVSGSAFHYPSIVSSADGMHLVIIDAGVYSNNYYTSSDAGVTWTEATVPDGYYATFIASSASGQNLAITTKTSSTQDGPVYLSRDYGVSWTLQNNSIPTSAEWSGIVISQDGATVTAITYLGYVWKSTDSGQSWANPSQVGSTIRRLAGSLNSSHLYAVSYGGDVYESIDAGQTWNQLSNAPSSIIRIASSLDGSHLVAWSATNLYASADYGQTWTQMPVSGNFTDSSSDAPGLINISADGSHIFAAPYNSVAYVGALADVNLYDNNIWTTVTGTGPGEPSGTLAMLVDSAFNIYTGGVANTILGGKDVNILHDDVWSPLGSGDDTPVIVAALALGSEVHISTSS